MKSGSSGIPPLDSEKIEQLAPKGQDLDSETLVAQLLSRNPDPPVPSLTRYFLLVIIIPILVAAVIWSVGYLQREGNPFWRNSSDLQLIEAKNDIGLFLEKNSAGNHIFAKRNGHQSWQLVSGDDLTVLNPALAPDGSVVAYVSQKDNTHIVVTSIFTTTEDTTVLDINSVNSHLTTPSQLRVCSGTPIAWHPIRKQIAFFGCTPTQSFSVVLIADMAGSIPIISTVKNSESRSAQSRNLQWLNEGQLLVTFPPEDQSPINRILTLDVH